MATLISTHNSNGCTDRCDAKCYNAHEPECKCCCGGVNHGVGLTQARVNTRLLSVEVIKANSPPDVTKVITAEPMLF